MSRVSPYPHQVAGILKLRELRAELDGGGALWMDMGTGKTRVAFADLVLERRKRVLIVVPTSVAGVWRGEAEEIGVPLRFCDAVNDSITTRAERVRGFGDGIVLTNYEAYWRKPLGGAIEAWGPDAVVLDEAQRIKNRTTRQARFAHNLAIRPYVKYRLALSGTPVSNGPLDLWSIYRFVCRRVFESKYIDFEQHYAERGYMKWQIKYKNLEELQRIVDRTSFRVRKDDLLKLPREHIIVPIELGAKTRAAYNKLRDDSIAKILDAEGQPHTVIVRLALTAVLRLAQIADGFAVDDKDQVFDLSTEKLDAAVDLANTARENGERVVIFARFRHDLDMLQSRFPHWARLDGRTPKEKRPQLLRDFKAGKYDGMLVQIRTGSVGIDLVAASVAIFYSTGYSYDDFTQALDRIHRFGQTRERVLYYHLHAVGTVDKHIYNNVLMTKQSLARQLVDPKFAMGLLAA